MYIEADRSRASAVSWSHLSGKWDYAENSDVAEVEGLKNPHRILTSVLQNYKIYFPLAFKQ